MDDEQGRFAYWEAIHALEDLITQGHCTKDEIKDDLELDEE